MDCILALNKAGNLERNFALCSSTRCKYHKYEILAVQKEPYWQKNKFQNDSLGFIPALILRQRKTLAQY